MATKWEFINFCFLPSQIKDSDLSIRDTTAETRLWVWLVLTIPVTPYWWGDSQLVVYQRKKKTVFS